MKESTAATPSSPVESPGDGELVFGELAARLEARARRATVARGPERQLRVAFRRSALAAPEASVLERLGELDEHGAATAGGQEALSELVCPPGALERAARDHAGLACLWAAARNARTRPEAPRILGVVNTTPDSFSDGGRCLDPAHAVEHGLKLVSEGADMLDVGGESTRPGSRGVDARTELERVVPVVRELAQRAGVPISIDTTKAAVAEAALDAGASAVNDVSAGRADPEMLGLVARRGCEVFLMHMQGSPADMQRAPRYHDVVREVTAHLRARVAAGLKAGIRLSKISVDPGIGFGKRLEDNLELIRALPELRSLGLPVLLGVSRKTFLGRLAGEERPERRVGETAAAVSIGCFLGAAIHRVHEPASVRAAVRVASALAGAPTAP